MPNFAKSEKSKSLVILFKIYLSIYPYKGIITIERQEELNNLDDLFSQLLHLLLDNFIGNVQIDYSMISSSRLILSEQSRLPKSAKILNGLILDN